MDLDLSNLWLHWFSILDLSSFRCGNVTNEGFKWRKENLPVRLEILQAFFFADARVSWELVRLEVEDEVEAYGGE